MKRPIIITTATSSAERYFLRKEYITEIEHAGGTPIIVAASNTVSTQDICTMMDGLYLTGGDDIHPSFYGEEVATYYDGTLDILRDQLERELVIYAIENKIPIFGICRGMQALNVFLGGSLYQDIAHEREDMLPHRSTNPNRALRAHGVMLEEGSNILKIMENKDLMVNTIHHQGVKELGKGLTATGIAPDGLIEAIELADHPFTIGVEWHPEELKDDTSRKLFTSFVDAARAHTKR